MNKFVLLLLVATAIAVGYLLGTEKGREQRDQLIEALNRRRGIDTGPTGEIDLSEAAEAVVEEAVSQSA